MSILLAILILIGFATLFISISQNRNSSNSYLRKNVSKTSSIGEVLDTSSSSMTVDWDSSIFQQPIFKEAAKLYQQGIEIYQILPEKSSQCFQKAFKTLEKLSDKYSNNPRLYFNMLECAMGFDYDIAIDSGYKFFELIKDGKFNYDQVTVMYDASRKMYKILLVKNRFNESQVFAEKTLYICEQLLKVNSDPRILKEQEYANFFYTRLSKGDYSVTKNIGKGEDGPEPWYQFYSSKFTEYFSE